MRIVRNTLLFILGWLIGASLALRMVHADELPQPDWKIGNFHVLDVDRLSLEYSKIKNQRDGYYVEDDPQFTTRSAFLIDFKVAEYFYWQNDIHMMTTEDRVRAVGWQWEGGVHLAKYADVFWFHHSQHVLERGAPEDSAGYPLENRYGARINFILH